MPRRSVRMSREILADIGAKFADVGTDAADLHAQGNRDRDDGPEDPPGRPDSA